MKYILSTILLVSVAAILISERRPNKPFAEIKESAVDTSAGIELLEGSISPPMAGTPETISTEDSIAAEQRAKYEKKVREKRKAYMAIIKKQIPRSLPFELSATSMQFPIHDKATNRDDAITNLIHGPGYGLYSRDMPRSYEFVAYLGVHQGHHMVVYRMASDVSDVIYPVTYYLATLTDDGEVLSKKNIANMESPQHITTAKIDAQWMITSQWITQTWQYKPEEAGYEKNKVIKSEVKATAIYRISGEGLISGT